MLHNPYKQYSTGGGVNYFPFNSSLLLKLCHSVFIENRMLYSPLIARVTGFNNLIKLKTFLFISKYFKNNFKNKPILQPPCLGRYRGSIFTYFCKNKLK